MKKFFSILFFVLLSSCTIMAQSIDTVFHKSNERYEVTVLKKEYHHLYTVKYNGLVDSVWQWDFAAYLNVKIIDIIVEDDIFLTINSTYTDIGYAVYEYKNSKWTSLMGGVLRFVNRDSGKIEPRIISKDKIQIVESGKSNFYKLDLFKKTIELSN